MTQPVKYQPMFSDAIRRLPLSRIDAWLDAFIADQSTPIYSSVDIRISSNQVAVVDANLFPAGFNNIHPIDFAAITQQFRTYIQSQFGSVSELVLISEAHTRNAWYLENVYHLTSRLFEAGYRVTIATFLDNDPEYCSTADHIMVDTAGGHRLALHCIHQVLSSYRLGQRSIDLAILNNDLTTGLPEFLKGLPFPVIPTPKLGWHQRRKSTHFDNVHRIASRLAGELGFSDRLITCHHCVVDAVDITIDSDRDRLAVAVDDLIHQVTVDSDPNANPPLVFLKSDSGTYGMGVVAVSGPQDVLELNRKNRNKLAKGKGSEPISQFIIQEGVQSDLVINGDIGEVCAYQIGKHTVGGFYRLNKSKSGRDNLNSQGMYFLPIPWGDQTDIGADQLFIRQLCHVLAKLSVAAICLEIESAQA